MHDHLWDVVTHAGVSLSSLFVFHHSDWLLYIPENWFSGTKGRRWLSHGSRTMSGINACITACNDPPILVQGSVQRKAHIDPPILVQQTIKKLAHHHTDFSRMTIHSWKRRIAGAGVGNRSWWRVTMTGTINILGRHLLMSSHQLLHFVHWQVLPW